MYHISWIIPLELNIPKYAPGRTFRAILKVLYTRIKTWKMKLNFGNYPGANGVLPIQLEGLDNFKIGWWIDKTSNLNFQYVQKLNLVDIRNNPFELKMKPFINKKKKLQIYGANPQDNPTNKPSPGRIYRHHFVRVFTYGPANCTSHSVVRSFL